MSSTDSPWVDFSRQIAKAGPLWQSVDVRAVAINLRGIWHNLFTRCMLDERLPADVPPIHHLPSSASIQCLQRILPIDGLDTFAATLLDGHIPFDECDLSYKDLGRENSFANPYWQHDARFHLASDFYPSANNVLGYVPTFDFSFERFTATGTTIRDLFSRAGSDLQSLDNELRVLQKPVDGLDGLVRTFLGMDGDVSIQQSTLVEVVAPYEAELIAERCTLSDSLLQAVVTTRSERILEELDLGLIWRNADTEYHSNAIKLRDETWSKIESDRYQCEIKIENAGAPYAILLLRTASRCIYRLPVTNRTAKSNTRIRAYAAFDDDLDELRIGLDPDGPRRASEFEGSVARLFHFLGFSVDVFGGLGKKLDSVDAIAFSESPPICLALECTTGSINSGGKLGKLVERTKRLDSDLEDIPVQGVIATSVARSGISAAEIVAAGIDRLAILANEDLQELLATVGEVGGVTHTIRYVLGKVPVVTAPRGTQQDPLFG